MIKKAFIAVLALITLTAAASAGEAIKYMGSSGTSILKTGKMSISKDFDRDGVVEKAQLKKVTTDDKELCLTFTNYYLTVTGKNNKVLFKTKYADCGDVRLVARDVTCDGKPELIVGGVDDPSGSGQGFFVRIYKVSKGKLLDMIVKDEGGTSGLDVDGTLGTVIIKAKPFSYQGFKHMTVVSTVMQWRDGESRGESHKVNIYMYTPDTDNKNELYHEGVFDTKREYDDPRLALKEFRVKIEKDDLVIGLDL